MVMKTFALPDLGEGLQEAEIVSWHVAEGDHVIADQPLVSVETEKAVVEVPAPGSGTIAKLHGAVGDVIAVGQPLVDYADESQDVGAIVGALETTEPSRTPKPASAVMRARPSEAVRAQIIPSARRRVAELGLDPGKITGTGPGGIITLGDVEAAVGAEARAKPQEGFNPLRGPRRAMAEAMARSGREVVPSTVMDDAGVEDWIDSGDITLRLVRAIARGTRAEPALNAWFDGQMPARRLQEKLDLGIAVDTPDGLFVPVVRDAGSLSPAGLRAEIDRLHVAVRERTLTPAELKGATFTLSNFGTIGGRHAVLVVVPPQVAILGAGRVLGSGGPQSRRVLPLSLTFDHRAATGGEAARFLNAVRVDLELSD